MSRRKISTTIGLTPEVFERLKKEKAIEERSFGYIIELSLREHFKMGGGGVKENADQVTTS